MAVDDVGPVINPMIVDGQLHGGIAQGIGQALFEGAVYSDDGQLLTGSLMDYAMPKATDLPDLRDLAHRHALAASAPSAPRARARPAPSPRRPAVVNAVMDALAPLGIKNLPMPLTPQRVWQALQGAHQD